MDRIKNNGLVIFLFFNFILILVLGFCLKSNFSMKNHSYEAKKTFEQYVRSIETLHDSETFLKEMEILQENDDWKQRVSSPRELSHSLVEANVLIKTLKRQLNVYENSNQFGREVIVMDLDYYTSKLEQEVEKLNSLKATRHNTNFSKTSQLFSE